MTWLVVLAFALERDWLAPGSRALVVLLVFVAALNLGSVAVVRRWLPIPVSGSDLVTIQVFAATSVSVGLLFSANPQAAGPLACLALVWLGIGTFFLGQRRLWLLGAYALSLFAAVALPKVAGAPMTDAFDQTLLWLITFSVLVAATLLLGRELAAERARQLRRVHNLRAARAQIQSLVSQDALTRAFKRQFILRTLETEQARLERYGGVLAGCLIGVEGMREINERHGFVVGDQVLRQVAERLLQQIRATDHLGRYSGTEFLLLLPGTDLKGALECAERLRAAIADPMLRTDAGSLAVTVAVGVSVVEPASHHAGLLARATAALDDARGGGSGRIRAVAPRGPGRAGEADRPAPA
jgi:diguanylate cyclase (GGDEF)-like protein